MSTLTADDFKTYYDENKTFPFFEDESATGVFAFGHLDKTEFAEAVNDYDRYCESDSHDDRWKHTEKDVHHAYAVGVETPDGLGVSTCSADYANAVPVTVLSR